MKTEMSRAISLSLPVLSGSALASLPRLEELPPAQAQELIQALAALLLHDPDLQALLEARHEPGQ
jgi:hypothetical protein